MIYLILALIGLVCGGIINALADDLPARRRPSLPHCYAEKCQYVYGPAGWLAIGRYLFYGGKCPECGAPERLRPILTELATAIILGLLPLFINDLMHLIITAFYLCVLILIIVIDVEHKLIL
ncbi:MAG: A24 family peptidase, partial [Chloroflexota bacterium]